jgi:fructose-bisphosphate aldolase, class I
MRTWTYLDDLGLNGGKKTRLHRILFQHGLRNGTALFLPYDQGPGHRSRDSFANPAYVTRLAIEGGFNGIAIQIGLAERFYWDYSGEVPLILKLNGTIGVPPDEQALSPLHTSVEDAVRLGGDAVGYTLHIGAPSQDADFARYRKVRDDAHRLGMPLIVWAYPRGSAIEATGGNDSFYAVDYAARSASELGADVVTVNFPRLEKREPAPRCYDAELSAQQAIGAVIRSADRTMLLVSGDERAGDDAILENGRLSMEAGATGLIFGRDAWQRGYSDSLLFVARLQELLAKYPWDASP